MKVLQKFFSGHQITLGRIIVRSLPSDNKVHVFAFDYRVLMFVDIRGADDIKQVLFFSANKKLTLKIKLSPLTGQSGAAVLWYVQS